LVVGTHRFGNRAEGATLTTGIPEVPRFGLTVDPSGNVTLVPPPNGIGLDGITIYEPTPIVVGQVIDGGTARFVLASVTTAPVRLTGTGDPYEIHHRSGVGLTALFNEGSTGENFGRVTLALDTASRPIDVDLLTRSIAIVGHRASTRPIATWAALSVITRTVREELGARLFARGHRSNWSWFDAMPILPVPNLAAPGTAPLQILIIDEDSPPPDFPNRGSIVLLDRGQSIPDQVGLVLTVGPDSATLLDRGDESEQTDLLPIGVSSMFALEIAHQAAEHVRTAGGPT
jgi:hypothetical protein